MRVDPNAQNASDIQIKFDFYFVALIFTILGLAIQTAKQNQNVLISGFEMMSWICLLVAGLMAIKRLIHIPSILHTFSAINKKGETIEQIKLNVKLGDVLLSEKNEVIDAQDALKKLYRQIEELEVSTEKLNKNVIKLLKAQLILFILALVFLILSRGFENYSQIYFAIANKFSF